MTSKMQLHAVGTMCPGYKPFGKSLSSSVDNMDNDLISCETCDHWINEKCNIDYFDKVLSSLDQT